MRGERSAIQKHRPAVSYTTIPQKRDGVPTLIPPAPQMLDRSPGADLALRSMTVGRDSPQNESTGTSHLSVRCLFCGAPHGLSRAPDQHDECGRCASPLFPAKRQRLDYLGQRMLARVPKDLPVKVYTVWTQTSPLQGAMRDLSLNGMQFVTSATLPTNLIVKIETDACSALGRVAYSRREPGEPELWATGVEFLSLRFARSSGIFVSVQA
jgi:hypothetical protein